MLPVEDVGELPRVIWELENLYRGVAGLLDQDLVRETYDDRVWQQRVGLLDVLTDFLCPPWVDDPLNLVRIVV